MQDHHTLTPQFKTCYGCRLDLALDRYSRDRSRRDGLQSYCKQCRQFQKRQWREQNIEHEKEYFREYRKNNISRVRQLDRERYRRDKVKRLEECRRYRAKNRAVISERRRLRRRERRDEINDLQRRYYHRHKGNKSWLVRSRNRKDKMRANGGHVSTADWQSILDHFDGKCAKCGSADNVHMDHVVPISRGGKHSPSNIQPLCRTCNLQKYTKTEDYRGKMYRPLALPIDNDT